MSIAIQNIKEAYINELLQNQNCLADPQQKNHFSREMYDNLFSQVETIIASYPDDSIQELRNRIFFYSGIEGKLREMVSNKKEVPGLVVSYGNDNFQEIVTIGKRREYTKLNSGILVPNELPMMEDTIFDIASITKVFTSLAISKLMEITNGEFNLDSEVTDYAKKFLNLKGITVGDLLTFTKVAETERINDTDSYEVAEAKLFNSIAKEGSNLSNSYTDINAMILKYVVEGVSSMQFEDFVQKYIIEPVELQDTYVKVPKNLLDSIASNNYSYTMNADGSFTEIEYMDGNPFDLKARKLQTGGLTGHAGLFSTILDLQRLSLAMIKGEEFNRVSEMGKNRTGHVFSSDGKGKIRWTQHLGELCYSKNPILDDSEVFHGLSGNAMASSGWNGLQLTVDSANKIYLATGANRPHNRVSRVPNRSDERIFSDKNGARMVVLPTGESKVVSADYAWDKSNYVVNPGICLALQYSFLDRIFKSEGKHLIGTKTRELGYHSSYKK